MLHIGTSSFLPNTSKYRSTTTKKPTYAAEAISRAAAEIECATIKTKPAVPTAKANAVGKFTFRLLPFEVMYDEKHVF
jgi:hypothetical protein